MTYLEIQLAKIKLDLGGFNPMIQIFSGGEGGHTNVLRITPEQLEAIKQILLEGEKS